MSSATLPASHGSTPSTHVLSARAITKSFTIGDRTLDILHGVDLDLARGELVSLMGASGAGKSTFLHILGLLESPTAGEVFIEGKSAWKLPVQERAAVRNQKLGFVFQFYHLLPELDAVENVLLPAMILHGRGAYIDKKKALRERARALLVKFGLEHRLEHRHEGPARRPAARIRREPRARRRGQHQDHDGLPRLLPVHHVRQRSQIRAPPLHRVHEPRRRQEREAP